MEIVKIVNKFFHENTYILISNQKALIIDPGSDSKEINEYIKNNNLTLLAFLITHYHPDHIESLDKLNDIYNVKVIDYKTLGNILLEDFNFEVVLNKGHSEDSISFHFKNEKILFSGDFIFKDNIGATHFEGGSESEMIESLKAFKNYDRETTIYPGHGEHTKVGYEIDNNYYIKRYVC